MKIHIDPLDSKFSKLVRLMHPVCEVCGSRSATQVHHFKGRRYQSVRFSLDNVISVCFTDHRKFHEDPEFAVEFMRKRLGARYDAFILMANSISKRYKADKKLLSIWIESEIRKYENCERGEILEWNK